LKSEYLTLSDLGRVLKKRWMPILAVTLILAVLVAGGGLLFHAVWESTSVFYVRNFQSDAYLEQYGLTSSQLAVIQTLAKDYAELLPQSDVFLDRVVERAGVVGLDRSTLRDCLRALPDGTSFRVTVSHTDAQLALHLSRVIEQEVPLYIQETVWPNLQSAHTSVTLLRASEGAVKVFPRPALFGSIAAAAGALLTYIYFLLRFLFGNRLEDEEEIVRALPDVPLLSSLTLPHSGADDALTALRTAYLAALGKEDGAVIGISSTVMGEGKEELALALAASLAAAGRSVLLVDADWHAAEPMLPVTSAGLSEVLGGSAKSSAAIERGKDGIARMSRGKVPATGADLLACPAMAACVTALRAEYDDVLLLLPTLEHADATVPATVLSSYLLAVRPRICCAKPLRGAASRLSSLSCRLLGTVAVHEAKELPSEPT